MRTHAVLVALIFDPCLIALNCALTGVSTPTFAQSAPASAPAVVAELSPRDRTTLEALETLVQRGHYATALDRARSVKLSTAAQPRAAYLRARCLFEMGCILGPTEVRSVAGGRVGQISGEWLPIEARGADRFLCAPAECALVQLRRALDGGVDDAEAYLLHGMIWHRAGRSKDGWAILQSQEARISELSNPKALEWMAQVALAADDVAAFVRIRAAAAARIPARKAELLQEAYLAVAEHYSVRGDEAMHREFLRRAVEARDGRCDLVLRLADSVWQAGDTAAALPWYRRFLDCDASSAERTRVLHRLAGGERDP
jgi:tetratricopeptide (TPR) repeat protein